MSSEIQVSGRTYRIGRLDAMRQFHVARKLVPVITSLGSLAEVAGSLKLQSAEGIAALKPVMDALAAMPDADCEFVLGACLSVTQRQNDGGTGWSPVWNVAAKRLQFEDIGLPAMLQIAAAVLRENLGGFFPAAPST